MSNVIAPRIEKAKTFFNVNFMRASNKIKRAAEDVEMAQIDIKGFNRTLDEIK